MSRVINLNTGKFRHEPVFLAIADGVTVKVKNDLGTGMKLTELATKLEDATSGDGNGIDGRDTVAILNEMYNAMFSKDAKEEINKAGFTFGEWSEVVSIAAKSVLDESYKGEADEEEVEDDATPSQEV